MNRTIVSASPVISFSSEKIAPINFLESLRWHLEILFRKIDAGCSQEQEFQDVPACVLNIRLKLSTNTIKQHVCVKHIEFCKYLHATPCGIPRMNSFEQSQFANVSKHVKLS